MELLLCLLTDQLSERRRRGCTLTLRPDQSQTQTQSKEEDINFRNIYPTFFSFNQFSAKKLFSFHLGNQRNFPFITLHYKIVTLPCLMKVINVINNTLHISRQLSDIRQDETHTFVYKKVTYQFRGTKALQVLSEHLSYLFQYFFLNHNKSRYLKNKPIYFVSFPILQLIFFFLLGQCQIYG